jgi:hypothetical protein
MLKRLCSARQFATITVAAALFFAMTCTTAFAQTSGAGSINGTVTDSTQAVVASAAVTITNVDTGVSHKFSTNSSGLFVAPFLPPGHYKVDATAANMGTVEAKNLNLLVGQTLTIDLTLSVKSATTTVEVTSQALTLDPEKTEVSQVVDQELIESLPVAARNWSSFVLLTPAVVQDGGSGLVSFHGISGLYNQNYVDGANNNQMLFAEARGRSSGAPYVYSIDSIKEFQAETSNYSVEFGQAAGGQVNAITKSGTNALHGDLFYYLRYPDLNALDPLSKYNGTHGGNPFLLTQPIHQQNQFGGSIGGPVIKDKLFYFLTVDGFRKVGRVLYSNTNTISTTGSGVYTTTTANSKTNGNLVTPYQCPTMSNSAYTGSYYITDAQCAAGIAFLQTVGQAVPSRYARQNLFFPRLDYHLNQKNDMFVDFNYADFDSTNGYSPNPTYSNSSPSTNGPTSYHERFLVGGLTTAISDRSVNQVHVQWGRDLETAGANAAGPSVGLGVLTYGMPNALPRVAEPDEHRIQFTDVFSHVMGRHTLKFGGDANIVHEVMINLYQGGGLYSYGESYNSTDFQDWLFDSFQGQAGDTDPYAGYHYKSFVQTVDVVNTAAGTQGKDDFWMKMYDGFAQDTWNVNRKLTVNAGVRYDIQLTPAPGMINNNYAPLSTLYTQTIKNTSRVSPRIGISFNPMPGTVIRGGYGLYTALNQGSTYYAMRVENGVVQINYNYSGCLSSCTPSNSGSTIVQYPNVPFQPTGPALSSSLFPSGGATPSINGPTKLGAQSFHGLDPNFVPPYSHEMELSIEQAMPGNMSLSIGYVGTRGMRLPVFLDSNLVGQTPHGIRTYNVLDVNNIVIKQMTVPVYLTTDRINASLSSFNTGFSVANTWYNAMAVTVRRPFANGIEVLGNYTWAHASDDGQVGGSNGTFYGGDVPLDPNNLRLENGPSDTNIRNRFTLSFLYQPVFHSDNAIVRNLANGFSFSGSEIASGGQPVYLGMSGTVSGLAEGGIYGGAMSSGSGTSTTGRPPQIGRNSINMPGFNDVDFRLKRKFPIHDQMYMELVGEAFNALNHTIVTSVNSTYSVYGAAVAPTLTAPNPVCNSTTVAPGTTSGFLTGCITPNTATGTSTFNAMSGSNNGLYGPRQLQVSAKFFF